jgi:hypothetical protein
MPGFTGVTGGESIMYADNCSFDGTERTGAMTTDGQLFIGATAAPHIKKGVLTSPGGTISIGYSSPNITLDVSGGAPYISLSPFIVGTDTHSGYSTIAAAITAAVAAGATNTTPMNVYIKPKADGTAYTENLTMQPGVNLIGFGMTPTILGKISYTQAGSLTISNLTLKTNSDYCISLTGSAASVINIINCNIIASNNTAIQYTSSNSSSEIFIYVSLGDIQTTGITLWSHSSAGNMVIYNSYFTNSGNSSTSSDVSAGFVYLSGCGIQNPISSSSTGSLVIIRTNSLTATTNSVSVTFNSSGTNSAFHYDTNSGSGSCISIGSGATAVVLFCNLTSSNTNVLTGLGTLKYGYITYAGTSSGHNVSTNIPIPTLI